MAEEEFQESDIMFQDNFGFSDGDGNNTCFITDYSNHQKSTSDDHSTRKKISVPINVPHIHSDNKFGYACDDDDKKIMPPHVILGQRFVGKMAFSICSQDGRTLKGRRMWEIRDFILRLTGFLET